MKISSLQENLKNGLFMVGHIAGKNVNLPILSNVFIDVKDGHIHLVTTDLEVGIVCTVRGKVAVEGGYTIEAKVLSDYMAVLPNKKVDIELKDNKLLIECDNYKTIIKGQGADDYPLIPKIEKKEYYKIKIDDFKKALAQVIFAVSTAETRVELSGVYFNFTKDQLTLAATDSYRLAEKTVKINTNVKENRNIIVPAKTLQELVRILSALKNTEVDEASEEISIYLSENQILFAVTNVELVSRLIEGQYPDYQQIIPKNYGTTATINRIELTRAVKAAAIFSKTGINDVNLDFPAGKNQIVVTAASGQTGENITELEAQVKGKDNGIVLNYRYLLDGLNNIDSENVILEVIDANTPCILKPEQANGYLYIVMPIKQ